MTSYYDFNRNKLNEGVIGINTSSEIINKEKIKISIQKKGQPEYVYFLHSKENWFPLQLGNGEYHIDVYEQDATRLGQPYNRFMYDTVRIDLTDKNIVFLQPNVYMNWDDSFESIKFARNITGDDDYSHTENIWKHIIENFEPTENNIEAFQNNISDIEKTFHERKGSAFDLVSLFNSMLRSIGIPSMMCTGKYRIGKGYHVWSKVYFKEKKMWGVIDLTLDMFVRKQLKQQVKQMPIGGAEDYVVVSIY